MPTLLDIIMGKKLEQPEVPVCPDHKIDMHLRGKLGRPTRFADQTSSEYDLLYFCPHETCAQTEMRTVRRSQIPVPGASPDRPEFTRLKERSR